jgi:hypothetical protein
MAVMRAQPDMPTGENTVTALRRLRQRWLAPSPPLAVDDEPLWRPAPDHQAEPAALDVEAERPAPAPAT